MSKMLFTFVLQMEPNLAFIWGVGIKKIIIMKITHNCKEQARRVMNRLKRIYISAFSHINY